MWKMRCLSSLLLAAIGFLIKPLLPGGSRLGLILSAAAMSVIDLAVNILLALNIDKPLPIRQGTAEARVVSSRDD